MDIIRGIIAVGAAAVFAYAGVQMSELRSVGGDSVAEYFYQAMGLFSYGMAGLCLILAVPRGSGPSATSVPAPVPSPSPVAGK